MNNPECEYEHEHLGTLCASFEFDVEEWLEIIEEYKDFCTGTETYTIIERTTTCIHCGQTDVCYPV